MIYFFESYQYDKQYAAPIYKGLLKQAVDSKDGNKDKIVKKRAIRYIRHCISQFILPKD